MATTARTSRPNRYGSIVIWGGAAALLLIPAVAMRFTAEVDWTALDFVTMGVLLAGVAGAFEFLARKAPNWTYRAAAGVALVTALLLVWINLAVGVIGSERNDANLMFAGVLTVAVGGACLARFRAGGLARAMLATAGAQALVGIVALATRAGVEAPSWPTDVIGVSGLFVTLWLAAAALFRRAARVA